jgi:hypothetical protein
MRGCRKSAYRTMFKGATLYDSSLDENGTCQSPIDLYGSRCLVIQGTYSVDPPLTYCILPQSVKHILVRNTVEGAIEIQCWKAQTSSRDLGKGEDITDTGD